MDGMDLGTLLSTALAVVALATAAGLGLMRGTVTNLREQLADTRASNAEMRQERAEDRAEIATLHTQLDALGKVVTGEVHWLAISDLLDEHHGEARAYWTRAEGNAAEMLSTLRAIQTALDAATPHGKV